MNPYHPSRPELVEIFAEEIQQLNGEIQTRLFDGDNLFIKATLPQIRDVARGDSIQHGVAVRTHQSQLSIHPYSFREVCRNGAIHINNLVSRTIYLGENPAEKFATELKIRESLRECSGSAPFKANLRDMKNAQASPVEITIAMTEFLKKGVNEQHITQILAYLAESEKANGYDLFNAITATARDIEGDEEEKWNLEALGGGVFARLKKPRKSLSGGNTRSKSSKKSSHLVKES